MQSRAIINLHLPQHMVLTGIITFIICLLLAWALLRPFWQLAYQGDEEVLLERSASRKVELALRDLEEDLLLGRITEAELELLKPQLVQELARAKRRES